MAYWLKSIYNRPGRTKASEWRSLDWISDHHRFRGDGSPSQRPGYSVGDEVLLYSVTEGVCPARFEVSALAQYDPKRVEAQGNRGDGKRWGWLTEVRLIESVDLDRAPTLEEIGVSPRSVGQKDHITLSTPQYRRAESRIDRRAVRRRTTTQAQRVPLEERHAEEAERRQPARTITAFRNEQRLVRRYGAYLEGRGREVSRHLIRPPGVGSWLYNDLYEHSRGNLVEAKSAATRSEIRMAIGQLNDYARFLSPRPKRWAVLVPEKPSDDLLALLRFAKVDAVWPRGSSFADTAGGALS